MVAPMVNMQMPVRLSRLIQFGGFQNVFSNTVKQLSVGVLLTQRLCTQSQSSGTDVKHDAAVPDSENSPTEHAESRYTQPFNPQQVKKLISKMDGDMPLDSMPDPFEKKYRRCLICEKNIEIDWKCNHNSKLRLMLQNVRLLSQFVSPFTGRIYGRHITGLCIPMQKRVARLIKTARKFGYMAYMNKDPHYLNDPKLFDPFRPQQIQK